jgi:hypothetical protein
VAGLGAFPGKRGWRRVYLIFRGFFGLIDDENFDRASAGFQP